MSSVGIKFVPLPEPLQKRLTNVMKKVESGEIDADWGGELFMHYFSQRLGIIANSSPHYEKLHKAAKGQRFALIIKGTDINHTAILGDTITDFTIEKPSKLSDPAMIFINMDIFLEVILSKKDLMRAGLDKQVEVRKMAQMFKWMAPVLALQDDKTQQLLEEKCPPILDGIVTTIEEKYGLK